MSSLPAPPLPALRLAWAALPGLCFAVWAEVASALLWAVGEVEAQGKTGTGRALPPGFACTFLLWRGALTPILNTFLEF